MTPSPAVMAGNLKFTSEGLQVTSDAPAATTAAAAAGAAAKADASAAGSAA